NGRPVRPAPRCPELPVVGPYLQIFVASAEDRYARVRPIRLMVCVLREPVEHLEEEVALVHDRNWLHAEIVQQSPKPLPLVSMREVKARFRQHGIADCELIGG